MKEQIYLEINGERSYFPGKEHCLIGREKSCDIILTGEMISRKHADVYQKNGMLYIRDLHSKHGTIVNGKKIDTETEVPLIPGDEINLVNQAYIRIKCKISQDSGKANALHSDRSGDRKEILIADETSTIVMEFLNVVDSIEYGLKTYQYAEAENPHRKGLQMILEQAQQSLLKIGVAPINALGKTFDPNLHNAVMHVNDPALCQNIVKEVIKSGYTYKGTVLRFADVIVAN